MYTLYIGNKNYSSWSLRPWLLMQHFGLPFREVMVDIAGRGANDLHRAYSANGLVPCLHSDGFQVWDSLAIGEFLAEQHPEKNLWPTDPLARARARSISAEMHSGFADMRSSLGMNIKLRLKGAPLSAAVASNVARIDAVWCAARDQFANRPDGSGGPYLFGQFSIADAMYAPVVWRFFSYNIALSEPAQQYLQTMLAHPGMKAWESAALAETAVLAHYDETALTQFGGSR